MVYIVTSRCGGSLKIVTISFRWWWFAPEAGFLFWKCATLRGDREAKGPLWGHKISWTHISHRINISVYYNPQKQLFAQYCHESTHILNIFGYFPFCDSVNFVMYFFMFRYILFNVSLLFVMILSFSWQIALQPISGRKHYQQRYLWWQKYLELGRLNNVTKITQQLSYVNSVAVSNQLFCLTPTFE